MKQQTNSFIRFKYLSAWYPKIGVVLEIFYLSKTRKTMNAPFDEIILILDEIILILLHYINFMMTIYQSIQ